MKLFLLAFLLQINFLACSSEKKIVFWPISFEDSVFVKKAFESEYFTSIEKLNEGKYLINDCVLLCKIKLFGDVDSFTISSRDLLIKTGYVFYKKNSLNHFQSEIGKLATDSNFFQNIVSKRYLEKDRYLYYHLNKNEFDVEVTSSENQKLESLNDFCEKLEGYDIVFNGGMFKPNGDPLGGFFSKKYFNRLDTSTYGYGNFYIQPNGVFCKVDNSIQVITTSTYLGLDTSKTNFLTQSGPMLLVDGIINSNFSMISENRNLRNGVGMTSSGEIFFINSLEEITFFDLAKEFKKLGCVNALYLDGFVSDYKFPGKSSFNHCKLGPKIVIFKKK
jgi:uncharacterized protein YigE (DUF2233 family)